MLRCASAGAARRAAAAVCPACARAPGCGGAVLTAQRRGRVGAPRKLSRKPAEEDTVDFADVLDAAAPSPASSPGGPGAADATQYPDGAHPVEEEHPAVYAARYQEQKMGAKGRWPQRWSQRERFEAQKERFDHARDAEIEKLKAEIRSVRLQAERVRKEAAAEAAKVKQQEMLQFVTQVLPVRDRIEALAADGETADRQDESGPGGAAARALAGGMELTRAVLDQVLQRHKIQKIPTEAGTPFDPAQHRLQARWRYAPSNNKPADPRVGPSLSADRTTGHRMQPGTEFDVDAEEEGPDGLIFLRLASGDGWMFNQKPGVGTMCEKVTDKVPRDAQVGGELVAGFAFEGTVVRKAVVSLQEPPSKASWASRWLP
eukprot:TRINITY_DN19071_c0_g1_i1.p1 TRINITY_DN19071_c0_g1~~TRINITY_DN19071_c0_g1_i1.p1  ORF type:complete len:374 (+),score=76.31 TRINITY_DN19071_c0_g1_i1:67-1188(+)